MSAWRPQVAMLIPLRPACHNADSDAAPEVLTQSSHRHESAPSRRLALPDARPAAMRGPGKMELRTSGRLARGGLFLVQGGACGSAAEAGRKDRPAMEAVRRAVAAHGYAINGQVSGWLRLDRGSVLAAHPLYPAGTPLADACFRKQG